MSLLMNALKKAETAKQQAGANAATAEPAAPAGGSTRDLKNELGLDDTPYRAPAKADSFDTEPAMSGGGLSLELPEPPAPLAIPKAAGPTPPRVSSPPGNSTAGATARSNDVGAAARNVFSAKQPKAKTMFSSDSKAPFYALVGGGLLAVAGYGGYLWMQITTPAPPPRAPVAAGGPTAAAGASGAVGGSQRPTDSIQMDAGKASTPAESTGVSGSGAAGPGVASLPPQTALADNRAPGTSSATPYPDNVDSRSAGRADTSPASGQVPQQREGRSRDVATASGGVGVERPRNLTVTRTETPAAVQPDIAAGYAALQSGDLDRAAQAYERAVRADPTNRDALLGAGTLQMRLNRPDLAEVMFRQVLRHHPQDTFAAAQLAALTGAADPVGTLSQVNSLIARESGRPDGAQDNGALQFMQGNQFAVQGRWPEAQQAYFNAHRADPNNADYCFNLAVSLDRIREVRLARDFYIKALELARTRGAGFDQVKAQTRLNQLNDTTR